MRLLSDCIEDFIKTLMEDETHEIELRRNELAEHFQCAPSQINYVLATRFTPDHGYVTSSQRGGGGYIRIVRIVRSDKEHMQYLLRDRIGESITAGEAQLLCLHLHERGVIGEEDAQLMIAATSASPVESIKHLAPYSTKPLLLATTTFLSVSPSISTTQTRLS